jgi:hypothetical protein
MYIYMGTQMDKIPWQRKNQTQKALICIDTQNEESCSIMCTTDPDQARGGIATLVELNKIPFLVQTHKEATP